MTRDDVLRLAREAGFMTGVIHDRQGQPTYPLVQPIGHGCIIELESIIKLAVEEEREACAALAEEISDAHAACDDSGPAIVRAIRARSTT